MFTSQHCTHSQFAYLCTLYQLKVRMPRWALSWAWTHGCPRDSITWHYMMGNVNPWDFSTPTKVVLMHHESENPEHHPQFRNFKPTKSAIPIVWGLNNSLSKTEAALLNALRIVRHAVAVPESWTHWPNNITTRWTSLEGSACATIS